MPQSKDESWKEKGKERKRFKRTEKKKRQGESALKQWLNSR